MIGLVLWSDIPPQKAVVWCEDQGGLAFYTPKETAGDVRLKEGDLVRFDVALETNFRRVVNPVVLQNGVATGLSASLAPFAEKGTPVPQGEVIPFPFERSAAAAARRQDDCNAVV